MKRILSEFEIGDLGFFVLTLCLCAFGLVMVYSASSITALDRFGDSLFYLKRQGLFLLVGIGLMLVVGNIDHRRIVRVGIWVLCAAIAGLVLIHLPGVGIKVGGAKRWLGVAGFAIQPAEFAKLACIIYMTHVLVKKGERASSFAYGLVPMLLVAGLLAGLLMLQPDFGNAVLISLIAGTMIFLAGAKISYLLGIVLWSIPLMWALIMGAGYRRARLMAFLDPWSDPQNTSYQILQSFTAFYSGGLFGTGLGNSHEKLYYLPEVHTDFIAAVVGEELGFVGVAFLSLLFAALIWRGYKIALHAPNPSGFLLAAGCTTLLGFQSVLNLFVVMGLVPTKGLPLPFFSHGGSALIVSLLACGLIQSVALASIRYETRSTPWLEKWGRQT